MPKMQSRIGRRRHEGRDGNPAHPGRRDTHIHIEPIARGEEGQDPRFPPLTLAPASADKPRVVRAPHRAGRREAVLWLAALALFLSAIALLVSRSH